MDLGVPCGMMELRMWLIFFIRLDDFFVVTTSDFASLKCEASVGCSNLFEFWIIKVYYSNLGAFF